MELLTQKSVFSVKLTNVHLLLVLQEHNDVKAVKTLQVSIIQGAITFPSCIWQNCLVAYNYNFQETGLFSPYLHNFSI